ncbi:MAG: trypsin-like peptidase domain-containing protein, partial [Oscillospiraceae bacterium]|nr:trypsin-like peptidase domain-containing protein [Oscillospiraceae bacterium]
MSEKNFEIANHRSNKGGFHMKKSTVSAGLFGKIIAVVLLCCLVGGFAVAGSNSTALAEDRQPLTPAEVYEQNVNSTVGITISGQTTSRYGYGYTFQAAGSGFIITSDGYILTNYHVIADSEKVTVATYDNETYDAKVIGYDESNDIAVLKIEAEGLKPVTLGDSNSLRVGDTVLAIGNPLGELTFSLTRGIVSALSRSVAMSSGSTMSLIQTDCAINSGNSGGALFHEYGEVIGITNAKYSSSGYSGEASFDNIGFAIPIY